MTTANQLEINDVVYLEDGKPAVFLGLQDNSTTLGFFSERDNVDTFFGYRLSKVNLPLTQLRKECKAIGVKLKKETLSWGPHISFEIDGNHWNSSAVIPTEDYNKIKERGEKLEKIKSKFKGMTIDNQKVYGLS